MNLIKHSAIVPPSKSKKALADNAKNPPEQEYRGIFIINWFDYFTESTSVLNVSGLFIAKSANTLRSRSIPLVCSLLMNWE
jgi:hypothetical protein